MDEPDGVGGVGEAVGGADVEALRDLVGVALGVVDDVVCGAVDVVGFQVGDRRKIRVGCLAVVALVEVVGEDLPVEVTLHCV